MPRTPGKSPAAVAAFLKCLGDGWSVTGAAHQASLARESVYRWRVADKKFATAWDHAVETATDRLEDELHRRAVHGSKKTTKTNAKGVVTVTQASDRLLMALLAARRPDRFRPVRKALEIQSRDEAHESAKQRLERKLDRMARALRATADPGKSE